MHVIVLVGRGRVSVGVVVQARESRDHWVPMGEVVGTILAGLGHVKHLILHVIMAGKQEHSIRHH